MTLREEDEYGNRLTRIYAEQYAGLRDSLNAVNRNVLLYIAEGRERGEQIDTMIVRLGVCASELTHIKFWGRILIGVIAALVVGVIALLVRVF
jgi:hypothetical protein